jgi:hypothetical protein
MPWCPIPHIFLNTDKSQIPFKKSWNLRPYLNRSWCEHHL